MFEEVERTCDRIGMIRNGKLAAVDLVETLRERHMRTYTVHLDSRNLRETLPEILMEYAMEVRLPYLPNKVLKQFL